MRSNAVPFSVSSANIFVKEKGLSEKVLLKQLYFVVKTFSGAKVPPGKENRVLRQIPRCNQNEAEFLHTVVTPRQTDTSRTCDKDGRSCLSVLFEKTLFLRSTTEATSS